MHKGRWQKKHGHFQDPNEGPCECNRESQDPCALLVGMQTGEATVENNMEFPQKTKNGTAL